jgi:hypothetical protein
MESVVVWDTISTGIDGCMKLPRFPWDTVAMHPLR